MSDFRLQVLNELDFQRRMQMMALTPRKRRQILGGIGRELKRQTIRNLRAKTDIEGNPWAPRKHDGKPRKLLRHVHRQLAANVLRNDSVEVRYSGAVALQQHEGTTGVMTGRIMQEGMTPKQRAEQNKPAKPRQAKALRDENFKIRVRGTKKWRKPSLRWIQDNLTQKKAGLILAHLRGSARKASWVTTTPARTFLGATPAQINRFVNKVFDNTINSRV